MPAVAARLAALLFAAVPALALAWGNEGHRVTGLVADELLTAKARIRLNQLVPGVRLGEFANDMDIYRQALSLELPGSDKWHYDNQPVCATKTYADYCPNGQCASSKIPEYFRVLADTSAPDKDRARAAMFVIHMVGDIHQPLHAADDADLGGNQKAVRIPNQDPLQARNLHRIWDSDLVKQALRGISEPDFAKELVARHRDRDIPAWQKGEVRDWMNEALLLSQKTVYGPLPEYQCGVAWPPGKTVELPQSYVDQAAASVPAQLAKAGARIAWLLNRALDPQPGDAPLALAASGSAAPGAPAKRETFVMLIRLRHDLFLKWKATGKWPDDAEANKALGEHAAYWRALHQAGTALMAGGMKGDYWDNAALIVFEAANQEAAEKLVAADPAVKALVFQAQVRPFDLHWIRARP